MPLRERKGVAGMVRRQWAWFVVVVTFLAGAAYGILPPGHWRRGSAVMGVALVGAAGLRLLLGERSGLLRVRHKAFDVVVYVALGIGVLGLAFWVPPLRPSIDR